MTEQPNSIESFFRSFEQNSASSDVAAAVVQFADFFLAAGPQGVKVVSAQDFGTALPARRQFFERLGRQSIALVSLEPLTLSARYTLVRTRWRMTFSGVEGNPSDVVLDSTFLVDTGGESFKIVLYLSHQDILTTLREKEIPVK